MEKANLTSLKKASGKLFGEFIAEKFVVLKSVRRYGIESRTLVGYIAGCRLRDIVWHHISHMVFAFWHIVCLNANIMWTRYQYWIEGINIDLEIFNLQINIDLAWLSLWVETPMWILLIGGWLLATFQLIKILSEILEIAALMLLYLFYKDKEDE